MSMEVAAIICTAFVSISVPITVAVIKFVPWRNGKNGSSMATMIDLATVKTNHENITKQIEEMKGDIDKLFEKMDEMNRILLTISRSFPS